MKLVSRGDDTVLRGDPRVLERDIGIVQERERAIHGANAPPLHIARPGSYGVTPRTTRHHTPTRLQELPVFGLQSPAGSSHRAKGRTVAQREHLCGERHHDRDAPHLVLLHYVRKNGEGARRVPLRNAIEQVGQRLSSAHPYDR